MHELEAIKLAARLRQLIRTMNEEQERTAAKLILAFDAKIVFECVEEHAQSDTFFNLAKFMEVVRLRSRGDPAADQAKAKSLEQYARQAESRHSDYIALEAFHAKQDKLIADFKDDGELNALKEMVIANCDRDDDTKKFMRTKSPRTSRLIKSMIYAHLSMGGEIPA